METTSNETVARLHPLKNESYVVYYRHSSLEVVKFLEVVRGREKISLSEVGYNIWSGGINQFVRRSGYFSCERSNMLYNGSVSGKPIKYFLRTHLTREKGIISGSLERGRNVGLSTERGIKVYGFVRLLLL